MSNDVALVMGEDSAEWHRDIQERCGWKTISDLETVMFESCLRRSWTPSTTFSPNLH